MKKLSGVIVPMIAPFDANDEINIAALKQLINFLLDKGINCLYPNGTTGEMYRLSIVERKKIAEVVTEETNGRAPVVIHVGSMRMDETLELAKHAYSIGSDGIGAITPSFFSVNDREMEEYYVAIAKAVPEDFPVYLYNIPQCSANDIKPRIINNIVGRCPNVVGIKYSFVDMMRTFDYLNIKNGEFDVVHGADYLFLSLLVMGCKGTVSGVAGVYPEPFVEVYKAFRDGDLKRGMEYQKIAAKFHKALLGGKNMAYYKEALNRRGVEVGHMRLPQLDLNQWEKESLHRELEMLEEELELDH